MSFTSQASAIQNTSSLLEQALSEITALYVPIASDLATGRFEDESITSAKREAIKALTNAYHVVENSVNEEDILKVRQSVKKIAGMLKLKDEK